MAAAHADQGSPGAPMAPPVRELVLTRTFDAPSSLVFKAWIDPKHLARWWGPSGFTNPVCEVDARPGGAIRIDMTGPDGVVYPMKGVFHQIVEPERLVFACSAHDDEAGNPGLEVINTVTFAEQDGKTTLTLHAVVLKAAFPTAAAALAGMEVGWTQSLERFEAEVAKARGEGSADREFFISRNFDAPRALVFQAWTEPDRLARWFGPTGFTLLSSTLDLRPGGVYHYGMRSPDGHTMWGKWVFREVVAPERLVFVASFSDETGGVTRHPFAPDWPLEVLSTLTFTDQEGRTRLTMQGVPQRATESERKTFEAGHESMQKGWTGTLDQLAEYLATA
jgi:uncharacterized protein YndB with AHSA1/START domain